MNSPAKKYSNLGDPWICENHQRDLTVIVMPEKHDITEYISGLASKAAAEDPDNSYLVCLLGADEKKVYKSFDCPKNAIFYFDVNATMRDIAYKAEKIDLDFRLDKGAPIVAIFLDRFQLLHMEAEPGELDNPTREQLFEKIDGIVARAREVVEDRKIDFFIAYSVADEDSIFEGMELKPKSLSDAATRIIGLKNDENGEPTFIVLKDEPAVFAENDETDAEEEVAEPAPEAEEQPDQALAEAAPETVEAEQVEETVEEETAEPEPAVDEPADEPETDEEEGIFEERASQSEEKVFDDIAELAKTTLDSVNETGCVTGKAVVGANAIISKIGLLEETPDLAAEKDSLDYALYMLAGNKRTDGVKEALENILGIVAPGAIQEEHVAIAEGIVAEDEPEVVTVPFAENVPESVEDEPEDEPAPEVAEEMPEEEPAPETAEEKPEPAVEEEEIPEEPVPAEEDRHAKERILVEYDEDYDYMAGVTIPALKQSDEKLGRQEIEAAIASGAAAIDDTLQKALGDEKLGELREASIFVQDKARDKFNEITGKDEAEEAMATAQKEIDDGNPENVVVWITIAVTGLAALGVLAALSSKKPKKGKKSKKGKKKDKGSKNKKR